MVICSLFCLLLSVNSVSKVRLIGNKHACSHRMHVSMTRKKHVSNKICYSNVDIFIDHQTGSATGWRVGWVLSPKHLTETVRAIHDNMAMQAPTPLQFASGQNPYTYGILQFSIIVLVV